MAKPIIKVSHLFKIYQAGELESVVLSDVNLTINKGEFVAIMGPSGSGKSTLMHILGALDRPSKGEYILDGENVGHLSDDQLAEIRNRKIGFVFQAYNLLPRTSAVDNVRVPMEYADIPDEEQLKRAKELLELVGLSDRLDYPPNKLSGGQQQRVAIARALVMNPAIILADEPTGNVSSKQSDEIMGVFQELNRRGHTVVMITHDPETAEFSKEIIHLLDGRVTKVTSDHKQRKG